MYVGVTEVGALVFGRFGWSADVFFSDRRLYFGLYVFGGGGYIFGGMFSVWAVIFSGALFLRRG